MSWTCCKCGEEHLDQFDLCWKCGSDIEGVPSPSFEMQFEQLSDTECEELLGGGEPLPLPIIIEVEPVFIPPPKPFRERLNAYLHRDADASIPVDTFRSRMPLWIRRLQLTYSPAKSVEHIRKLLIRIHQAVKKSRLKT
jgi:hypothetical protein